MKEDLTIEFAFLYCFYTDKANAAMQESSTVRFRPLTMSLAQNLAQDGCSLEQIEEVLNA